ncbi:MAG: hypothetical protein KGK08_05975 [Acidobacteriota bacterium]|nr:hypothetical protein [Acidobacteriota bacterium]
MLLVFAGGARALMPATDLSQYRRQTWQNDSGLPQDTVYTVLQSRDGFLWLGTDGGLVRFDGMSFRVFDTGNTPQMHSNLVNALAEDAAGRLWIGTEDGLLALAGGELTRYGVEQGLPSSRVLRVLAPQHGALVVATAAGLAVEQQGRFRAVEGSEQLSTGDSGALLAADASGTVWAAGGRSVLALHPAPEGYREGQPLPVPELDGVQALCVEAQGTVWVGGRQGLVSWSGNRKQRLSGLPSSDVRALLVDATGTVWVGTEAGLAQASRADALRGVVRRVASAAFAVRHLFADREGVVWVAGDRVLANAVAGVLHLAPAESGVSHVLAFAEDRDGDLWLGTDGSGLSVLREQLFHVVAAQEGLSSDVVRAVLQDASGAVWLGTTSGLDRLQTTATGARSVRHVPLGAANTVVLSLAETVEGGQHVLWAGTPDGLARVAAGGVKLLTVADGLPDNFVRSLYADRDGSLWVGTRNGLAHWEHGRFTVYSSQDGLGSDVIGAMLRGRDGALWIGTLGGLTRWDGQSFRNRTTQDGLGRDAVTSLYEDSAGTLWIGTNGGGLTRMRGGKLQVVSSAGIPLPETVLGVLQDDSGNLWLSSRDGVMRLALSALDALADHTAVAVAARSFGVADGMRIAECSSGGHPAAWRMRDGTLWFATLKGVASVDPRIADRVLPAPAVAMVEALVDDVVQTASTGFVVAPGHERITLRYAGLSFAAPQRLRYRYRLRGFDHDWVEAGSSRTAYYTNVPPGTYVFEVLAQNSDGVWSTEAASLTFRVRPRFVQTGWFYGLLVLLLAAAAYVVYRVRVHYVQAEYEAVMAERGRIAREVHDTLAQGYVGIAVQLELVGKLMTTSREAAMEQLSATKELVRSSLAEARSSIWNLRAQGEDAAILPSRLAALARRRRQAESPSVSLQVRGTYRPLDPKVENELLRIAQEAINNAVRHAGAASISVSLTYDSTSVRLQVRDDGRGFTESAASLVADGHFGLQGMRERAAGIAASIEVESAAGAGTTVTVEKKLPSAGQKGEA